MPWPCGPFASCGRTDEGFCLEIFLTSSSQHEATRQRGNKKAAAQGSLALTSRGPAKARMKRNTKRFPTSALPFAMAIKSLPPDFHVRDHNLLFYLFPRCFIVLLHGKHPSKQIARNQITHASSRVTRS